MRWKLPLVLCVISLPMLASAWVNVTVSTPANNSTVTSPVLFAASATSDKQITGWRIYVDGASVYHTGAGNSIRTSLNIAAGTHQVLVRAWAGDGTYGSVALTETVGSSTPGTAQGVVTPSSLAFGLVATNTVSSSQTVKITNTGSATLNISGVSISPSQFTVSGPNPTSIAPGSSASYNVSFAPTAVSAYPGQLSFTTNSATAVPPVTLSGTGTDPGGTSANCSGTTYYVSTSGSDSNSGVSVSSPWKTVAKIVAFEPSLRQGDCVLFQRGGVWSEELKISNVHGSQSYPITFGNYGTGNLPVIDGGSTRPYGIVGASGSGQTANSYVTIDGFEVRNATSGGIIFSYLQQPGITIQNNYVHNNGYGAYPGACFGCFQVDSGSYGYNSGIAFVAYPNGVYGAKILNNIVKLEGGHNSIVVDQDSGSPVVQGNKVGPGCSHNCIDFKRSTGALFKQNIVNCSTPAAVNGQTYPACNGNAFYAEQDSSGYTQTGTYEENVAYGAAPNYACFEGIGVSGPLSLKFYNNTCYGGSTGALGVNFNGCGGTFTFKNNIFHTASIQMGTNCGSYTWDYNDKYNSSGPTGTHDMTVNPLFVNPGAMDFHLQLTSPVLTTDDSSVLGLSFMGACGTSGTCP
ncbi:MAG TPA: choice-of-anchor D domain-containing protein [Candidatus Angelobacter sp.]|nr:choice-of-anchor D domain-containing protein [Candidatus Angelobacter sp.]